MPLRRGMFKADIRPCRGIKERQRLTEGSELLVYQRIEGLEPECAAQWVDEIRFSSRSRLLQINPVAPSISPFDRVFSVRLQVVTKPDH